MNKADIYEMYDQELEDLENDYQNGQITIAEYVQMKHNLELWLKDELDEFGYSTDA